MIFADSAELYARYKELRKEDITSLKEWTHKQPHLPKVTELELIIFLHSCYYSLELAKTTIENFYTYRTHCPEFFSNRDPTNETFRKIMKQFVSIELPTSTPEGYEILFYKLFKTDTADYIPNELFKLFDMGIMQCLYRKGPAEGLVIVIDLDGFTIGHLMKTPIMSVKKLFLYLQEALPVRLKGIHYINIGGVMDGLMAVVKPFIKKEVADAIHFHETAFDKIYNYIPKECFPKDYGGNADPLAVLHENAIECFTKNKTFFEEDEKHMADESKRLGKRKNTELLFALEGSFKKLEVD